MQNTATIRFKPALLQRHGLPDIAYPVPQPELEKLIMDSKELPFALLLHGLQLRSQVTDADWQQDEPAMARLVALLTPDDPHQQVVAQGDDWWLEIGPVDLGGMLITIQRSGHLIAAISPREDGRLRTAVFRPLDGKSAEYLIGLSHKPHPEYGVNMRENNWEYALDASAGMGNTYAAEADEAYLSYWEKGLGLSRDGTVITEWRVQQSLQSRPPAQVAMELGVHYTRNTNE